MVLKNSKCGLNTGNTLRKGHAYAVAKYRETSITFTGGTDVDEINRHLEDVHSHISGLEISYSDTYLYHELLWELENLANLHHDMFYAHENGVSLSLNKNHRWIFLERLQSRLVSIRAIKDDHTMKKRWIFPKFHIEEYNSFTQERIHEIDSTSEINHYEKNGAILTKNKRGELRKKAARYASRRHTGVQRKVQVKKRTEIRADFFQREEDEEKEKLLHSFYEHASRPNYNYRIYDPHDLINTKHPAQSNKPLVESQKITDDLDVHVNVCPSRKSKQKTKGQRNKHAFARRFGVTQSELTNATPFDFDVPKGSYTYRHKKYPKHYQPDDTYSPANTYTKLVIIQDKSEVLGHLNAQSTVDRSRVPHPPKKPREKDSNYRTNKGENRTVSADLEGTNTDNTSQDKQSNAICKRNRRERQVRTKRNVFMTEPILHTFRESSSGLDESKFKALPPILPITQENRKDKKEKKNKNQQNNEKIHEHIPMWKFADACISRDYEQKVVSFSTCGKESICAISLDSDPRHSASYYQPQDKPSSVVALLKPGEDKATNEVIHSKKKNNAGKRRRDRIRRKQLRDLGQFVTKQNDTQLNTYLIAKIKTDSAHTQKLLKRYGGNFKDSTSSAPRKFWVDVSDRLFSEDSQKDSSVLRISAMLLFETVLSKSDIDCSTHQDASFASYRLYPHCDLSLESTQQIIEILGEKIKFHLIYPVRKIVDYFVEILKSIIEKGSLKFVRNLERKHCLTLDERLLNNMEWLYLMCGWKYTIHSATEAFARVKNNCDMQRPSSAQLRKSDKNRAQKQCVVCFKLLVLPDTSAKFEDILQGRLITIVPCLHSFCASCFQGKLESMVRNKVIPVVCPESSCNTILDPVTILSGLTLGSYNKHLEQAHEHRVRDHPQWQWCPKESCGRAIKLHGSAILDNAVVIQCRCGEVWCFHCLEAGHWPATCSQATMYNHLLEKGNLLHDSKIRSIRKWTCSLSLHSMKSKGEDSDLDNGPMPCSCRFDLCVKCVNVDGKVKIPNILVEQRTMLLEDSYEKLLPLAWFHCARAHGSKRAAWNHTEIELKTNIMIKQMQRSRSNLRSSLGPRLPLSATTQRDGFLPSPPTTKPKSRNFITAASWGGLPSYSPVSHRFTPTVETEKIFLILVHQFLFQAHFFLENIYVVLFCQGGNENAMMTFKQVMKLEKTIDNIYKNIDTVPVGPSQVVLKLKKQMESGKSLIKDITKSVQCIQTKGIKRIDTVLPLGRLEEEISVIKFDQTANIRSITKL